jgi:hypothetical protein
MPNTSTPALRRSTSASVSRSRELSPSTHKRVRCLWRCAIHVGCGAGETSNCGLCFFDLRNRHMVPGAIPPRRTHVCQSWTVALAMQSERNTDGAEELGLGWQVALPVSDHVPGPHAFHDSIPRKLNRGPPLHRALVTIGDVVIEPRAALCARIEGGRLLIPHFAKA